MRKFEVGQTYATRSFCDYDTIFSFTVTRRSATTVTLLKRFERRAVRRKIFLMDGNECCYPLGQFALAPILHAYDLAKDAA